MSMREKIRHSYFLKGAAAFLIFPLILFTSFSFPRPAQAAFMVPILITAILSSITLGLATTFLIDATTCYINIVWGCSNTTVNPDGTVTTTVIDIRPSNVSLSANPTTIDSGQSSTLTWSSTNATSCSAVGGFSTGNQANGSASTGSLDSNPNNYQVSCTNPGGSRLSNIVTVTVRIPTVSINATPDRVVGGSGGGGGGGGTTTVSWNTTNVNSCTITRNGIAWGGPFPADASRTVSGSATSVITSQTTFVINCTNNSGSGIAVSDSKIVNLVSSFQEF